MKMGNERGRLQSRRTRLAVFSFVIGIFCVAQPALAIWQPNDDDFGLQSWAWDNTSGEFHHNVAGAWDRQNNDDGEPDSRGADSVLVAVIDTGFRAHPDLADSWFVNFADPAGDANGDSNNDDDGNLFDDDTNGWDFAGGDNNPMFTTGDAGDGNHGTFVAGIIGATANNDAPSVDSFVAGVAKVKLVPLRVGSCPNAADAIVYATDMGAEVISLSLNLGAWCTPTSAEGLAVTSAISYANAGDTILFKSAGNGGPCGVTFPGGVPFAFAVAGLATDGAISADSCTGPEVDLAARSVDVVSVFYNLGGGEPGVPATGIGDGTSFAAPIAAGTAALVRSYRPDLTADQVGRILTAAAIDFEGDGRDNDMGWGAVDTSRAIEGAQRVRNRVWTEVGGGGLAPYHGWDGQPSADVDPWGYTHAVYITEANGPKEVMYHVLDQSGQQVFGPFAIEAGSYRQTLDSVYPDITVDGQGYSHIAWIEDDGEDYLVIYARLDPDGDIEVSPTWVFAEDYQIRNMNMLVDPGAFDPTDDDEVPNLYFVYDWYGGSQPDWQLRLASASWDSAGFTGYPVTIFAGTADDEDPSADIVRMPGICDVGGVENCIVVAWEWGSGNGHNVHWGIVDISGDIMEGPEQLDNDGINFWDYNPSIDVSPTSLQSAVAWSTRDRTATCLDTNSIRFAWVAWDGFFPTPQYPKVIGERCGGGEYASLDPTVSTTPMEFAGVAWTNEAGPVYAELGPNGAVSTGTAGSDEVVIGTNPGLLDSLFPQVVSSKRTTNFEGGTYDREDGNYRFYWIGEDPSTSLMESWYASTRPRFSNEEQITGWVNPDQTFPDITHDPAGGTHAVWQRRPMVGSPEIVYTYWTPGTSPNSVNWNFQAVASRANVDACGPKVEVTAFSSGYPGLVKTQIYVFYIDNCGQLGGQVYVTIYEFQAGGGVALKTAATQLAADLANAGAKVVGIDTTVFTDREGTFSNPSNTLPQEPILAVLWTEQIPNAQDELFYGAIDETNAPIQLEESIVVANNNRLLHSLAVAQGPGDRVYIGYAVFDPGTGGAWTSTPHLARWTLPTGGGECWTTALGPDIAFGLGIAVDRELEGPIDGIYSSPFDGVSDSEVHIMYTAIVASTQQDALYMRVRDDADRACGNGGQPAVTVPATTLTPPPPAGGSHEAINAMYGAIALTPDNRPVIVYCAERHIEEYHQWTNAGFRVHVAGLTNAGERLFFSDMPITAEYANAENYFPELSISANGELITVVSDLYIPVGGGGQDIPVLQEARLL